MVDNNLGMNLLDEDELDNITGGVGAGANSTAQCYCEQCKKTTTHRLASGGRGRCTICNSLNLV